MLQWTPSFRADSDIRNTAEGHSTINESLATLEGKVKDNYRFLREMEPDLAITASEVRDRLKGKINKAKTILEVFRGHNEKVEALVGSMKYPRNDHV